MDTGDLVRDGQTVLFNVSSISIDSHILQIDVFLKDDADRQFIIVDVNGLRPLSIERQNMGDDDGIGNVVLDARECKKRKNEYCETFFFHLEKYGLIDW